MTRLRIAVDDKVMVDEDVDSVDIIHHSPKGWSGDGSDPGPRRIDLHTPALKDRD